VAGDIVILDHTVALDVDIDGITINSAGVTGWFTIAASRNVTNFTLSTGAISGSGLFRISGTTLANTVNINGSFVFTTGQLVRPLSGVTLSMTAVCTVASSTGYVLFCDGAVVTLTYTGTATKPTVGTGGTSLFQLQGTGAGSTLALSGIFSSNCGSIVTTPTNLTVSGTSTVTSAAISFGSVNITFSGTHTNTSGRAVFLPTSAGLLRTLDGSPSLLGILNTSNAQTFLYTADALTGYPPEAKVEDGEVYGPSGEFTGELSPVNVNTAQLATDLFDAIIASSDPLAVRLKNTATVSTVNDAVASLNVIP
jgi:hypothetical protein